MDLDPQSMTQRPQERLSCEVFEGAHDYWRNELVADDELESNLGKHGDELEQLASEADRRLHDVNRRLDGAAARSAMVVSAAAIASGIQITQSPNCWLVGSIIASMASAALALPLVRFRRAPEVNVSALAARLPTWSSHRLRLEIINVKMHSVSISEGWMRTRSKLLLASLITLAAAIGLTALSTTLR